ncbi:unnamed protein product, partial [Mesorhabditis belari]|uniref:Uncharacterized protein n=1 Tax=Mesorhabditis belari TaxID=2138241 RepID=A0AAF3F4D0_9BILA
MGHDDDHDHGGMEATYKTQRPPWIGLWSSREYLGRPDWWKENGLKDDVVRRGKWRNFGAKTREEDPDYWDPKVPDGTSLQGSFGLDATKNKNFGLKADTPEELGEFQEKLMKGSHQYKAIAERWNLSKEHPGLAVSPNMDTLWLTPASKLGSGSIIPNNWYFMGPRFFDKPLNAAPHEKAFAAAKYVGIFMLPWTLFDIKAYPPCGSKDLRPRMYIERYMKLAPVPMLIAGTWGFTLSFAAAMRDRDDVHNQYYAAAASGFALSRIKNFTIGVSFFLVASVLGTFYHYARVSGMGLQGRVEKNQFGRHWGGPLLWKFFQRGGAQVPEKNF